MCLRKYFCRHDYHLLTTFKEDIDDGVGYELREMFIIYCPKCKNEKKVRKHEYEATMKRQEVDRSHARE